MPTLTCQAIIFDLDGVLIDSDHIYNSHWERWAQDFNISLEHILAVHHGRPPARTIEIVAPHLDAEYEAQRFVARLNENLDVEGMAAYDGVEALLRRLPADRWAIATSAPRPLAEAGLAYLDLPRPRVLITSDDVAHGKPSPEPYLRAAQGLGHDPTACLVIEDAPAGVASARAAGAIVVALTNTNAPDKLAGADGIVDNLLDVEILFEDLHFSVRWDGDGR